MRGLHLPEKLLGIKGVVEMLYRVTCITGVCFAKREARDTSAERAKGVGTGEPGRKWGGRCTGGGETAKHFAIVKSANRLEPKNGTRIRGYGKPPPHIIQFVYVWPFK